MSTQTKAEIVAENKLALSAGRELASLVDSMDDIDVIFSTLEGAELGAVKHGLVAADKAIERLGEAYVAEHGEAAAGALDARFEALEAASAGHWNERGRLQRFAPC